MGDRPALIEELLASGRLEIVEVNLAHAQSLAVTAERHVETARALAVTQDVAMAFTAAYDGARKALAAVLAVEGLRVRPVGGAHRNTGVAASAFVADDALGEFDWMRQVRNATEYPEAGRAEADSNDVAEAIEAAEAIALACARYVRERA